MADVVLVGGWLDPGALRQIDRLSGRLATRGVACRLVCVAGAGGGQGVVECPGLGSRWRRPWALRRLAGADGLEPPDLLHVLGHDMAGVGLELAERWCRPYVVSIEDFPDLSDGLRVSRRWFRGLIVPCADLADELVRAFGVPATWIDVVPPGLLDSEPACPAGAGPRIPVVGTAVAADRVEGLATFFRAARIILDAARDVEFVVASTGGEESNLRRLADWLQLKEHVTFADGCVDGEAFWRVLDVYCQSSVAPATGRGLAQALAHAVPAVASDVPGLRSWILPGLTGHLVPPGDPDALAAVILELLAAPEQARQLGLSAREFVARSCHPDREADLLAALYQHALSESLPPADLAPADGLLLPIAGAARGAE
jgi:glycosyltransferase involved in cell wall biosynthesis